MHLKKLTVQGFKSFVNRTTFEYSDGITAVVGPNGSGKSNVADALRWVLGEQSSKLLRAKRQDDIIFAGTRERGAVGMAEVLITLDNSEKWLPVDFAEVEIGRRLYRDGGTDYLLNGQRVRLRDVVDLLMKADLGQNSYAIMGQGLVDEVLSMSPEDRRSFLDEAADVKRFRIRITQAQDRLAATRENMERVTLIVNELTPRLSQLSRQAERAAEHAVLSAELASLLRVYFAHRWNSAQNRLVGARARLDQVHAETQTASARVDTLREQLRTLGEEIRRRREVIARNESRRAELAARLRESEQALALEGERRQMVDERRKEVLAEADALDAEYATLSRPNESDAARAAQIVEEEAAARHHLEQCRDALAAAEMDWTAAVKDTEELRGRAQADYRRREQLRGEMDRARGRLAQLSSEAERAEPRRRQVLDDLKEFGVRYLELAQHVAEAEIQLDSARETARHARERLVRVQDEVRGFETQSKAEIRELNMLEGRLEALRRVQAEHDGLAAGTRNALILGGVLKEPGATGAPDVPGILGLLASAIQVPKGYEVAINAALESRLHAVIVDTEEAALRAIASLRSARHGRAQFVALEGYKHVYPLNLQQERGVVGVAANLVRCPREVQPVVDTLLGRVIVCEDDEAARRMLKRALGTCVTLAGTLYEGNNVIYGGATGSDEGPFARQREIAELPVQIEALRERTSTNGRRLEDALAAMERLEAQAREFEAIDTGARKDLDAGRAGIQKERGRLHKLRQEMGAYRLRVSGIVSETQRQERALAQAEAAIDALDRAAPELEAAIRGAEPRAQQANQRRERALRAVADAGARAASVEGERRALIAVQQEQARNRERLANQARSRRAQADQLEGEIAAISARIDLLERDIAEQRSVAAADGGDVEPDRHELARLESHERQVQEVFAEAQQALLSVDRRRLDIEGEVARTEGEIETLETEMAREGLQPDRRGNVIGIEEVTDTSRVEAAAIGGGADIDVNELRARIEELRRRIRRLGPVNAEAPEDYRETKERHEFLTTQLADLEAAETQLREAITELHGEIKGRFEGTFVKVNTAFGEYFAAFFGGGQASLNLVDPSNPAESGVEIEAQPPGKKVKSLALLSGGERSLTAVALLFALLTVNPAPFCVLDEVDAALDEANVGRFANALRKLSAQTQFIVITHNRRTVEAADAIYGVSMNADGISRTLSLKLEDVPEN